MLHEVLTGELPFAGDDTEILQRKQRERPMTVLSRAPGAPPDLAAWCDGLLAADPDIRRRAIEAPPRMRARSLSPAKPYESTFVGRARELGALREALAESRTSARVVRVSGPAGIGKSALLAHFAAVARREGANVLAGRCHPQGHVPFRALDEVMDGLARQLANAPAGRAHALAPRDSTALVDAFPVLGSVPGFGPPSRRGEGGSRLRVAAALRDLLTRLAKEAPLLVVVDDAQWGDDDSAEVLAEAVREPYAPELCLVLVSRQAGAGLRADAERARERSVVLEPLPPDEATTLATALAERDANIALIVRESGGHALFLTELARERGRTADRLTLRDIILGRFAALTPQARRAGELLAVAGAPIELRVMAHAGASADATDELCAARLAVVHDSLSSIRVHHERIREIISSTLGQHSRRELHAALARSHQVVLPERAETIAYHLEATGDLDAAATALATAARRAADARAYGQAASLFTRAIAMRRQVMPESEGDLELHVEAADSFARAGRADDAAENLIAASLLAATTQARMLRIRAAEHLLGAGHTARGEQILDAELAALGVVVPRSAASVTLSVVRGQIASRVERALPALRQRADQARLDVLWSAYIGAMGAHPLRSVAVGALFAREASRLGSSVLARARATALDALGIVYRRGAAGLADALAKLRREVPSSSEPAFDQGYAFVVAAVHHFAMQFRESTAAFERTVAICARNGGHSFDETWARLMVAANAYLVGDIARLRILVPPLHAELVERNHAIGALLAGLYQSALELLERGTSPSDERTSEDLAARWRTSGGTTLPIWWLEVGRIQRALVRGDAQTAWARANAQPGRGVLSERLFASRLHAVESASLVVRSAVALAVHGRSVPERELSRAEASLREMEEVASSWSLAQVAALRAGLASVRGDHDQTLTALQTARALAKGAGMPLLAALAQHALGSTLGGDEGAALRGNADALLDEWRVDRRVALACGLPGAWCR